MTKEQILEYFKDINFMYNESTRYDDLSRMIDELEPKTGWIPVSERLPEKSGQYLVTVKKGYMLLGLWCGIKDDWINVIAWMPLPEPYKSESETKE